MCAKAHGQRPAQRAALYEFFQRGHFGAQSIEFGVHAEPGVKTKDAGVALHRPDHPDTLADGPGHGLFGPDVAAGIEGVYTLQSMPVRRSDHVHNVYALAVYHLTEIAVAAAVLTGLGALGFGRLDSRAVDVAKPHQAGLRVIKHIAQVRLPHAAQADNGVVDLVVGALGDAGRPEGRGGFLLGFGLAHELPYQSTVRLSMQDVYRLSVSWRAKSAYFTMVQKSLSRNALYPL